MNTRPIGIFDSGVGGMTVLKEIAHTLPQEDLIYLGDTKNFPYGNKSRETIINISRKCTKFLLKKNVKVVVIACGTATSQAVEELQKEFDIPIIGIIQPTVEAIYEEEKRKKEEKIGIMATKGTIRSNQWEYQLKQRMPFLEITNVACPLLAPMAEEGWTKNEIAKMTICEYLRPLQEKQVQKIILGCTHYPLFKNLIQQEVGNEVEVIHIGEKLANFLQKELKRQGLENTKNQIGTRKYYLTDEDSSFLQVANKILEQDIQGSLEKAILE